MKSYPSSELRNVCDEQTSAVEPTEEGVDLLQQMLDRRSGRSFRPSKSHITAGWFLETSSLQKLSCQAHVTQRGIRK